jgi:protein associated with RNAse G/E
MTFEPGRAVMHRSWRGNRLSFLEVTRVVADDDRGLFLWLPIGASYWCLVTPDGRTHHDITIDQMAEATMLHERAWSGYSCLMWKPADVAVSVWWFFKADGTFAGWYVNLEEPNARWDDGHAAGIDYADQALDIVVEPDYSWRWKDVGEFEDRTGNPLYWDDAEAAAIRAEGDRMVKLVEARAFPFDGSWCDFRPDPTWQIPTRSEGWDRPRAGRISKRRAAPW